MLKVAFIYPPFGHHAFQENLRVVDEDFGRLPPLSLLYAAAIAEKSGHQAIVVDANAHRLDVPEALRRLREFRPDVLAFSASSYAFHGTLRWIRELRAALGVPVVVGGINLRLYPEATMAHPDIDFGVTHFGLEGLPRLLEAIEAGRSPEGLPEVVARAADGNVTVGPVDLRRNPYDRLPMPARHLVDNSIYHSIISQRRNFTVMVTSTGCRSRCAFCAIPSQPRHDNPLDRVIEEVRTVVDEHGVREIDFFDADFFGERKRALELCERIAELGLDLEWSCRARLDNLDAPLLQAARRAGCRQIYVGIETPDSGAQRAMQKGLKIDEVASQLELMRRSGIRPLGFFMLGVPGETHRSALRTVGCAIRLPLDYAQFSRMIAKPGSALHRELVTRLGRDPWRDYLLEERNERLPNLWSAIDDLTVERYTKLAYLAFYFRPRYVLRALARMRSLEELLRSARTALRMLRDLGHSDV